jgi:predicted RNase H-like HicB family nuclease
MKLRIGLVALHSQLHAWVLDLPGCLAGGRDVDEIARMLPLAVAEHVAWLRRHGEAIDELEGWQIAETIDAADRPDFLFDADRTPLGSAELETLIARMQYARADLLGAVRDLPDAILDWEPPASAFGTFDPWAPDVKSIRDVVRHVLQLEAYYRDGLRDGEARGIFEDVADAASERERTVAVLRSLSDEERGRVYRPLRPSQAVPEEWTVRKVLRRIISHERAHTAEIIQRRTWILLGPPRLHTR